MSTLHVNLIGRFGNQLFQAAHARALADRRGCALTTNAWPGQLIFEDWPADKPHGECLEVGYCQRQCDLIYTRADCRRWFRLKPQFAAWIDYASWPECFAHRRVGDYVKAGYPIVSRASYERWSQDYGKRIVYVTEEQPIYDVTLPFSWLADWLTLLHAPILLRANSSFSWWAATLGTGRVYSPVIDGLPGGAEHNCRFVPGNWPKLADNGHCTDLFLADA